MKKILLAENDPFFLKEMNSILEKEGFEVFPADDGRLALDLFVTILPDLVISDTYMPRLNGFELLKSIRSMPIGLTVPIVLSSKKFDSEDLILARQLGVRETIFKPYHAEDLINLAHSLLDHKQVNNSIEGQFTLSQTTSMLVKVIETHNSHKAGHARRVFKNARNLAIALNWSQEELVMLECGALLHDIGKINIATSIISKTNPLTEQEQNIYRDHPRTGANLLKSIDFFKDAIPYVLYHHEWWNGHGYPDGLAGEMIPRQGRIMAIANEFDNMTSNYSGERCLRMEDALGELERLGGVYFDPEMVKEFALLFKG